MQLAESFARWSVANREVVAPNTMIRYRRGLRALARFGVTLISHVTRTNLIAYQDARIAVGIAARSVNGDLAGLVTLLRWLVKRREIAPTVLEEAVDLWLPVPVGKVPDFYTPEQLEVLRGLTDGWLRLALELACFTGLRLAELRRVEVSHYDLDTRLLRVHHDSEERTKTGRERVISMCSELVDILRRCAPAAGPLFPSTPGPRTRAHYRSRDTFERAMRALSKATGWHCTFHRCRRTFCTMLLRSGKVTPLEVMSMMGHADMTMISRHYYVFMVRWNPGVEALSCGNGRPEMN